MEGGTAQGDELRWVVEMKLVGKGGFTFSLKNDGKFLKDFRQGSDINVGVFRKIIVTQYEE